MLYTKKNSGAYHGQGNNYAHKRNMHCIRLNPMRRVVPPKRNTQSATMAGISRWWYWKLWKIFSKQIKNWGYNKTATAPESGHQFYWRGCKRGLPTSVSSDVSMLWSRSTFRIFPNSNFDFVCIKHLFSKHACNNCLLIRFHTIPVVNYLLFGLWQTWEFIIVQAIAESCTEFPYFSKLCRDMLTESHSDVHISDFSPQWFLASQLSIFLTRSLPLFLPFLPSHNCQSIKLHPVQLSNGCNTTIISNRQHWQFHQITSTFWKSYQNMILFLSSGMCGRSR